MKAELPLDERVVLDEDASLKSWFGGFLSRRAVLFIRSNIVWLWWNEACVCCATTMKPVKETIAMRVIGKKPTASRT
jgi:hypothetical protein